MEGYCTECKVKREIQNPKPVKMENGKKAIKVACGECGRTLYKILGNA